MTLTDVTGFNYDNVTTTGTGRIIAAVGANDFKEIATNDNEITATLTLNENVPESTLHIGTKKDLTVIGGVEKAGVSFTGHCMITGTVKFENLTVYGPATTVGAVSQFSKTAIACQNSGDFTANNVVFDLSTCVADATAVTAWWSNGDGANITLKNCTFNAAGQRPVRSDACVTIENCTINDPYRYVVQMTSKSSTMDASAAAYVNFKNNTINAGTTTGNPVYGVQLEGGYGCNNLTINGSGNKINLGTTGKTAAMYYCECGKVDHATITWNTEVEPEHESAYSEFGSTISISKAEGLMTFAKKVNSENNSFSGKTVILLNDIDMSGLDWEPIGQTGKTEFKGVFDGKGYTISNLKIDSEEEKGGNYSSGLFGWLEGHGNPSIIIRNVTIEGAEINGHHNCGALIGFMTGNVVVDNCHVVNADISCTNANADANGDKAGSLIGNGTAEPNVIKNCTATNCTVSAGRDAGQLVGACKESKVTNCSASNVTVTANGTGTGANIRNEVIGRLL